MHGSELLSHGLFFAYGGVFVGGFLTSLTPCVYPLIGITLALFGAKDEHVSRTRALLLAAAYVNGMGLMYAAIGTAVALAGQGAGFGTHLANPRVVVPMAALFIAMAASMFGAFELSLPTSLAEKLNKVGGKGFGGAFAMGLVGGIIAAPCTGPVLLSILTYIATTRSATLGATLLYTYALGMGVLFFVLALVAQKLPKSGPWMETVKSVFGVAMVLAALYFLRVPFGQLALIGNGEKATLWRGLALVGFGIIVGGLTLSFHYSSVMHKARKAVGVAALLVGGWMLLVFVLTPKVTHLEWLHDDAGITASKQAGKPALFDFYATWCLPCKELDLKTFADPAVQEEMARFTLVKVDNTNIDDDRVPARQAEWDAKTLPTVVILDSHGAVVERVRRVMEPAEFLTLLKQVK
jgi:thiol:disulfide interchange protein DsbD